MLSRFVEDESDVKKEEESIYKANQRMSDPLPELDELANKIFEALATNYVEVRGTRYSLATLHFYITHEESFDFDNSRGGYDDVCKVPTLNPQCFNAKVAYLQTLDNSQRDEEDYKYMLSHLSEEERMHKYILVDPLKLCDKTGSAEFDFMSEVKNVYLKQITSIDV